MWLSFDLLFVIVAVFVTDPARGTTDASDESIGCALPAFPAHGRYEVFAEGQVMEHFSVLRYSCDPGYEVSEKFSVCEDDNSWSVSPVCKEFCSVANSTSVDLTCYSETRDEIICQTKMPPGTTVSSKCKEGHTETELLDTVRCRDGKWDGPFPKCKAICGSKTNSAEFFPWHALIFRERSENIEQICAGSLIQPNLVITAAHCFYNARTSKHEPVNLYKVTLGKTNRSWNDKKEEKNVQTSEIAEILLHEAYSGDEQNQQNDIAIIRLTNQFQLSVTVMPVCYDLIDQDFDSFQTKAGSLGKIAALVWTAAGVLSGKMKVVSLPVIDLRTCAKELFKYRFNRYLTADKLCAGYINGTSLCVGDSGGGLVFPALQYDGSVRWFLRAISSIGPLNDNKTSCRQDSYTALSHVFLLRDWLRKELKRLGY